MPLMSGFWGWLEQGLAVFFLRCFYRLLLLATITGCLLLCATIIETITATSSTAAASAPFARAFPLLLLWARLFLRTPPSADSCSVSSSSSPTVIGRHDFLCLNRPIFSLRAAHFNDRRIARAGDGLANGIAVLIFFHQEVGNVEERIALQANVYKSGLHAGQNPRDQRPL